MKGLAPLLPLLDDTDPLVAISSLKLFEKWTRQNFGVKASEITPAVEAEISGLREPHQGSRARLTLGRGGRNIDLNWWPRHSRFRSPLLSPPDRCGFRISNCRHWTAAPFACRIFVEKLSCSLFGRRGIRRA